MTRIIFGFKAATVQLNSNTGKEYSSDTKMVDDSKSKFARHAAKDNRLVANSGDLNPLLEAKN